MIIVESDIVFKRVEGLFQLIAVVITIFSSLMAIKSPPQNVTWNDVNITYLSRPNWKLKCQIIPIFNRFLNHLFYSYMAQLNK